MDGKLIRTLLRVAIVASVAALAWFAYGLATGKERVGAVCAQIVPGLPFERLRAFAHVHDLSPPRRESGTVFLVEKRSFGRHGCRVELVRGVVRRAT